MFYSCKLLIRVNKQLTLFVTILVILIIKQVAQWVKKAN